MHSYIGQGEGHEEQGGVFTGDSPVASITLLHVVEETDQSPGQAPCGCCSP
jgi:hypothetical protein